MRLYHAARSPREARLLVPADDYETLRRRFAWRVPPRYNIGVDACDRQRPDADALVVVREDGRTGRLSFGWVARQSNRLANAMAAAVKVARALRINSPKSIGARGALRLTMTPTVNPRQ